MGVEIYLYRLGLLQTKSIMADGARSMFGTVNLDLRSFWLDYEVALFVYDSGFARELRALQQTYIDDSDRIDPAVWGRRSFGQRFFEGERILYGTTLLDRAEQIALTLRDQIETNMDASNAGLLRFMALIKERKALALQAMELIDSARPNQIEALKAALARNKLDPADFLTFQNLSLDEALKIEQLLLNRLEIVEKMRRQVEPDLKAYYAAQEELDQVYRNFHGRINTARVRLLMWSKAHQKMAAGVKDPAEWFDFTDITGELSDIAGKVIDRAL